MIDRREIIKTLEGLQKLYTSKQKLDVSFFAKTAILEACGWIEEAQDEIMLRLVDHVITSNDRKKQVKAFEIKRNYGFAYEDNLCRMMRPIIGYCNIQKIEKRLAKSKKFLTMCADLSTLKTSRDSAAHTHIKAGVTTHLDAPDTIKRRLQSVQQGMAVLEKELKKMSFIP